MKLILLSGGSGKRLWPLSNDSRSKQFLKLLKNDAGQLQSMVQRAYSQLNSYNLHEATVISTNKSQVEIIQSQLGQKVPLIIEPMRRDTFPAITLAATYLYSVQEIDLDETICVLPVDLFVEDIFFSKVLELENALNHSQAELALIGVTPTYPSSKYGYIVPKDKNHDEYLEVNYFKEKPEEDVAKKLIEQLAFWNCGVFGFKLGFLINLLEQKGLSTNYHETLNDYRKISKNSFDYEVVERARKIVVLPYNGSWKDLGTWNTLTEEMGTNQIGKGLISTDSTNTHLINELDIPITILGITGAVVAASPDGILVTDKIASPRIKDIMDGFENRPMYEERLWGWYKVLDHSKIEDGIEVLTRRICIKSGRNLSYQIHYNRSEVWTVLKGEGEFALNDKISVVKPGDVLIIPEQAKHAIKAITDLEFIEIQSGSELVEEDIVRIFMTWEEVEEHCNTLVK